jgi:hypothetical protein
MFLAKIPRPLVLLLLEDMFGAWVLPGVYETPTDPDCPLKSIENVQAWEQTHASISFGDGVKVNFTMGYMYNQILSFDPDSETSLEYQLKEAAILMDSNLRTPWRGSIRTYESLMLHFAEDTVFNPRHPEQASETSLAGLPLTVGYTASFDHFGFWLYQTRPWADVQAWSGALQGGALFVSSFEPLDALDIELGRVSGDSSSTLLVEYPSTAEILPDGRRLVSDWTTLDLLSDTTLALHTLTGRISFLPPADWIPCTLNDGQGHTYLF